MASSVVKKNVSPQTFTVFASLQVSKNVVAYVLPTILTLKELASVNQIAFILFVVANGFHRPPKGQEFHSRRVFGTNTKFNQDSTLNGQITATESRAK